MKEPSKKDLEEIKKQEDKRIAEMYAATLIVIAKVQDKAKDVIKKIESARNADKHYKELEQFTKKNYTKMFKDMRSSIVDSLNQSGVEQRALVEKTLGQAQKWDVVLWKTLPKTPAFKITNKILNDKAILIRSQDWADRITKIIAEGYDKGYPITKINKMVDIELGFKDIEGKLTPKGLEQLKKGQKVVKNGQLYRTARMVRTESQRMARIQTFEVFKALDYDNKRLKYYGTSDKRSRPNSVSMNGQISDKNAKFLFPDGGRYTMFASPSQYSINCRCSASTVFI